MNLKIGFTALRKLMSQHIRRWKDTRDKLKIDIPLHDVVMTAFSAMFYQSPSMLQFQQELEDSAKNNNIRTQFDVKKLPSTTQLKDVLDEVGSNKFEIIFNSFHKKLEKSGVIKEFKNKLNTYFVSTDGTQYYTSKKVHCKRCLVKKCSDGKQYSHQALQSAIVLPGKKVVVPIMPTEISNAPTMNPTKQDCEWKGFFRHLSLLKRSYLKKLPYTFLLDALFADQVVVKEIMEHAHNFIIVSKPKDNKHLHEEFSLVTTKKQHFEYDDGKYLHVYSWSNNLPLNSKKQVFVNFLNYGMKSLDKRTGEYKIVYKNSWITNHEISSDNVSDIVLGGRARWKVENECFNTLKNQGYNLEHSYGHGEKNLSFNFIVLTMLAFFMHQFLECRSELYQACRKKKGSKINLWNTMRTCVTLIIFNSFELLLEFVLNPELCTSKYDLQLARAGP